MQLKVTEEEPSPHWYYFSVYKGKRQGPFWNTPWGPKGWSLIPASEQEFEIEPSIQFALNI